MSNYPLKYNGIGLKCICRISSYILPQLKLPTLSRLYLKSQNTDPTQSLLWSFPITVPYKPPNTNNQENRAEERNYEEETCIMPLTSTASVAEPKLKKNYQWQVQMEKRLREDAVHVNSCSPSTPSSVQTT